MKQLVTIFMLLLTMLPLWAQTLSNEDVASYNKAKSEYEIGNIAEARSILSNGLKSYSANLKIEALHLLALCCLAEDEPETAEQYTRQLLKADPSFRASLDDNPCFADLLQSLKSGGATVTSASQLAETLEEVPVPTTLITAEMIASSGCTNLQDLLCLYVPGMTKIGGWENSVAMHGINGLYQENVLVMLNGHRLNSRTTNSETLDFRHSLAKIKQIEVLRGPASSLYGNVALTAVVNIITKSGNEIDGTEISAGIGSFNTYKADILMGKKYFDVDFTAWASIYSSKGQRLNLNPGDKYYYNDFPIQSKYMYVGGFNGMPSYDIGVTVNWKDFSFLFNTQYSKKVMSYTTLCTPYNSLGLYDYDAYPSINGSKPGNGKQSTHLEFGYNKKFNKLFIQIKGFADLDEYSFYNIVCDTLFYEENDEELGKCTYFANNWYKCQQMIDFSYGLNVNGGMDYVLFNQKGNILLGVQIERYKMLSNNAYEKRYFAFSLNDKDFYGSDDYGYTLSCAENGKEDQAASFIQIKQHLPFSLIFNGGVRFDYKKRYDDKEYISFSPRMALIWKANSVFNVKASYAHSFVDAGYLYRASTEDGLFRTESNLSPEKMDAWQFCGSINLPSIGLNIETNFFYNKLTDLTLIDKNKIGDQQNSYYGIKISNYGKDKIAGFEVVANYTDRKQKASLNITWQRHIDTGANSGEVSYTSGHSITNAPLFWLNSTYTRIIFENNKLGTFALGAAFKFSGKYKVRSYSTESKGMVEEKIEQEAYSLLSINARYSFRRLSFNFLVSNIYNTEYLTGCLFGLPVPNKKANCMLSMTYKI